MTTIRRLRSADDPDWLRLRVALWPDTSADEHRAEMRTTAAEPDRFANFLAVTGDAVVGLAEAALRFDYVNGTDSSPVAYLEGLYVVPEARRRGVARALVRAVEDWGRERGCREFASDALLHNLDSQAMHRALGFEETDRVVFFRKSIG